MEHHTPTQTLKVSNQTMLFGDEVKELKLVNETCEQSVLEKLKENSQKKVDNKNV